MRGRAWRAGAPMRGGSVAAGRCAMTELIVITFENEPDAEAAYRKVLNLQEDLVVELAGLALVKVDESGKKHVETPHSGDLGKDVGRGALFGTTHRGED